jgi:hypothetical protein
MIFLIALLLLVLFFGAFGFAIHLFWIIAAVALAIWILGFLVRGAERSWYRW